MVRLTQPQRGVDVACVRPVRCLTVENVNTARTWSSSEEVGGANRHVSDDDAQIWPFKVQMMERRTLSKTSQNW